MDDDLNTPTPNSRRASAEPIPNTRDAQNNILQRCAMLDYKAAGEGGVRSSQSARTASLASSSRACLARAHHGAVQFRQKNDNNNKPRQRAALVENRSGAAAVERLLNCRASARQHQNRALNRRRTLRAKQR